MKKLTTAEKIKKDHDEYIMKRHAETAETEIWIDLDGKVHKNEIYTPDLVSHHAEYAKQLYPDMDFPEDYLMRLGWIRVSVISGICSGKEPTQAQLNTLFDRYGATKTKVLYIPRKK